METSLSGMDVKDIVKELHGDLSRKYRTHASKIEHIWRSLDKAARTRCTKAGAMDNVVLQHPLDTSMGNVHKFIPEWNLRDITEPGSDFLLDLLKHRATSTPFQQYCEGINGGPGDKDFIEDMMRRRSLRHVEPFKDCYSFFLNDEHYGNSYHVVRDPAIALASFEPAMRAGQCIPQATGELILMRQQYILQCLNIMIEDILEEGSQTRDRKKLPKKPDQPASEALSRLTIHSSPPKPTLANLVATARERKISLEEYLDLLYTEPVVLAHTVNIWFFSRPELIPDERGRVLPVHTDKYISAAFVEAVHGTIMSIAIWNYLCRLLELLELAGRSSTDRIYRAALLQEIANVSHLEYGRAQALFKRQVQTGLGCKRFKRMSNSFDKAGNSRVAMKGKPEELTISDPQLHHMLRLCQVETTASKAVDWMAKLSDLHRAHPLEREKLQEREAEALSDLAVIVSFIQDLSGAVSLPSVSHKKGVVFVSRSRDLEAELGQLKGKIDLRDFTAPIDNLLEPGMADGALQSLDKFIVENTGTKMAYMYQDLVEVCLTGLQAQSQKNREENGKEEGEAARPSFLESTSQPVKERVEEQRQKEKTRPSVPHISEIGSGSARAEDPAPPSQKLKVRASTAEVFSVLFTKTKSRGSVTWTAFEGAMADLGFSVLPKFGSVYTFLPPENMTVRKSLTVHRPHQSRIEGYLVPIFARRLKRVFGWSEEIFEVA